MVNIKQINDERLGRWKNQLNRKHATPILIVGVGHDHNQGDLIILTTEERSDNDILQILLSIASSLKQKIDSQN